MKTFKALIHDECGAALTEYAMLLAVISIGVIGVLNAFNVELGNVFESVREALENQINI